MIRKGLLSKSGRSDGVLGKLPSVLKANFGR